MKKRIIILIVTVILLCLTPKILLLLRYECFWRKYFGIYCAGCGVTRMIDAITKFKFYQAFRYNQLFFTLVCLFSIYVIYYFICIIKKKRPYVPKPKVFILVACMMILYMLLRNINYFSYLRPTDI